MKNNIHSFGLLFFFTENTTYQKSDDVWTRNKDHGYVLYEHFPQIGVSRWVYGLDNCVVLHTMHITEVTETRFSGNRIKPALDWGWTLVYGTFKEDENYSFTINYDNPYEYLDCSVSFTYDEGNVDNFGSNGILMDSVMDITRRKTVC